jgi:exopolysaccharide production protein ExoQ
MKSGFDKSLLAQQFQRSTSRFHWFVALFLLLIQQGAFVSMPLIMADSMVSLREVENPFNTASLLLSILLLVIVCVPNYRHIYVLCASNRFVIVYMLIVIISALWSIHPDVSLRRGAAYIITMFVAFYISVRFCIDDRMKVLSWSFAVSAIGSILFVVAFPQYGIMEGEDDTGDLNGNWRGVFPHKNQFGFVMAAAIVTELYLIALGNGRAGLRLLTLSIYFVLLILSKSTTAFIISLIYLAGAFIYLIWKRNKEISYVISILIVFVIFLLLGLLSIDRDLVFGLIGKDATLTGRTGLWSVVIELIEQRPLVGWGYRAMWQVDDATTKMVDDLTGNWGVTSAHNGFLEITLELGLLGLFIILAIIGIAFWRGLRCCMTGTLPLGWFSLMVFIGVILAGQTIETIGQNQVIEWVIFNVLSFSCEQSLASKRRNPPESVRIFL